MSWDFTADDLRKELSELKEKLAVQAVKVGEQETKIIRNEEELRVSRENYADTLNKVSMMKLRKEADRSLELEEELKRRTDELRNEKNTRENVEGALRSANEEREREAASAREAQHYLNRTAVESNDYREQREKLASEKAKLESQVRELQGELQRHQAAPPPPSKTPARPRASSLTNLNKMTILERDIEQIRASASSSELDLRSTREKLSRIQSDLIRTENEKATLEKKLKEHEQNVKDILSEKEDLQAEVDFYRERNGEQSHEDELIARLEEEEAKVALLEKQLAQASTSTHARRAFDQLQARLNNEISRREDLEARETQLVHDREEAFNEVDDLKRTVEELERAISQKELRISEYETQCRTLQQLLDNTKQVASHSSNMREEQIGDMVNRIARLRAERDELKAHLDFVQMEAHFKVEALESKLANQTENDTQLKEYQSLHAQLDRRLNSEKRRLRTTLQAMVVTIQHLDSQNEHVGVSALTPTSCGNSTADSRESNQTVLEQQATLTLKEEETNYLKLRLNDVTIALRKETDLRSNFEEQVQQLEVDLDMAKQELTDATEHCERLEARHSSDASHDAVVCSLKNEIEELRNRVMRRTEQIGLQQHDIKRLETNMRLTDERLEEALGELEMAETAKVAMLEDCSIARDERDQAKKTLVQAELEIERLSTRLHEVEKEALELHATLAYMQENADIAQNDKLSTMIGTVADRDTQIRTLEDKLEVSETSLRRAHEQIEDLRRELKDLQESRHQSLEGLQKDLQNSRDAASEELEQRAQELQSLSEEVKGLKSAIGSAQSALDAKTEDCRRACTEVEVLTSKLADAEAKITDHALPAEQSLGEERTAHHETKRVLLAKEEELKECTGHLQRLTSELDTAKASRDESLRLLHSKERQLDASSAELNRLLAELEARDADRARLNEMGEIISRLETEKADLVHRLAVFENETEQELSDSASIRSILEEERRLHEELTKKLESDLSSLEAEKEKQNNASESVETDLKARCEEILALLETTKAELEEKRELCDTLANEQQKTSSCREDEIVSLKQQVADLTSEIDSLQKSLQDEIDSRTRAAEAHKEELEAALDKQESLCAVESELRRTVEDYQQQFAEVRSNLMTLQDENTALQSELDNLSGECHRANLKSQALERQLASSGKELSEQRSDLTRLREAFSQSEKSGKTAEMNLLLISQQNERTISSLRNQLKEHEKDAERIQKLQQIVGETREQISEMESLLKEKCAEIEENDDKFIQLLKEKKRLTSKVESLTKKNNALQKKLSTPSVEPSPPENSSRRRSAATTPITIPSGTTAPTTLPTTEMSAFSSSKAKAPDTDHVCSPRPGIPRETRRISGSKRRRESTPPRDEIPVTTSIGKKRPLPDDSDSGCAQVEARFPDAFKADASNSTSFPSSSSLPQLPSMPLAAEFTSTPRARRTAPRSGFTPVRGQSAALRPTLSQPSPVKKSRVTQALQAATVISDMTNSPPRSKRVFTTEPGSVEPRIERPAGKGWLGKIRSGANQLSRTRQQPNSESRS
ncbi:hypothetical protein ACEPAI_336 [Sanghuangporus weigelae]